MRILKISLLALIYVFIVAVLVIRYDLGYLLSLFLFFGIPSLYFSIRRPEVVKKSLAYALLFSLPVVFVFDYMAHVSHTWYVPSEIGIRIWNAFPLDQLFWGFLFFYLIIVGYNSFMVKKYDAKILSPNFKYLIAIIILLGSAFAVILTTHKEWLVINHFYGLFVFGVMFLPTLLVLIFNPQPKEKVAKIFLVALLSVILSLNYEYSALKTGQWFFNGEHYLGWIYFFDVKFPIEELLFMFFAIPGTICVYEFFSQSTGKSHT